jgi:hypothetical protein
VRLSCSFTQERACHSVDRGGLRWQARGSDRRYVQLRTSRCVNIGPVILEPDGVGGYAFCNCPRRIAWISPHKEKLDHGCAQAQDVAREHP